MVSLVNMEHKEKKEFLRLGDSKHNPNLLGYYIMP
jgi:hypothetical protein